MTRSYTFDSRYGVGLQLPSFEDKVVKDELMFFSASPSFAWSKGGPITRAFLDAVAYSRDDLFYGSGYCFDSRVHMLMPGWWPCIPGWHHDDVPRSRRDGQPNYETPEFHSQHILALVNGHVCPTEFAVGKVTLPHVSKGGVVYGEWHPLVEQSITAGRLERHAVPSNRLIHFDCNSFHQGTQAKQKGWRWFGRLTWDAGYENGRPRHDEIRRQVNVYMDMPNMGW
jgi:hypothetical protein